MLLLYIQETQCFPLLSLRRSAFHFLSVNRKSFRCDEHSFHFVAKLISSNRVKYLVYVRTAAFLSFTTYFISGKSAVRVRKKSLFVDSYENVTIIDRPITKSTQPVEEGYI